VCYQKKLKRITKKLFGVEIKSDDLSDEQCQKIEIYVMNDVKQPPEPEITLTTSHETVPTPTESDSMQVREQEKAVRGGKGKKRERSSNYVTGSHVERNVTYGRIKLSTGALLSLEPAVINAIKFLDPKMDDKASIKSSDWCDKAVANWDGQELNNAAIIRCSVINALLEKVQPC
jgi:hypothetical protein